MSEAKEGTSLKQAIARTVIIGGPKTGKTTLASLMDRGLHGRDRGIVGAVHHTDDLMHLEWSEASQRASEWFDEPYYIVEGVAAVRALRKWLKRNPSGAPCERVVYLTREHEALTKEQAAMTKGIARVFAEIRADLVARGVKIDVRS